MGDGRRDGPAGQAPWPETSAGQRLWPAGLDRRLPPTAEGMTACGKMGAQAWTRTVLIRTRHPHDHQRPCLFCVQERLRVEADKPSHSALSRRTAHLGTSQRPCPRTDRINQRQPADQATFVSNAAETASEHKCEMCVALGRFRGETAGKRMQSLCEDCRTPPYLGRFRLTVPVRENGHRRAGRRRGVGRRVTFPECPSSSRAWSSSRSSSATIRRSVAVTARSLTKASVASASFFFNSAF